jgi:diguanylate cyclase (GGDEF)-like protein/PAS domain S-box-containing protein
MKRNIYDGLLERPCLFSVQCTFRASKVLMRLTIRNKLSIILALGVISLATIGYLLYSDAPLRIALSSPGTPDQSLFKAVNGLRAGLKDIETIELRYALSGDPNLLTSYNEASSAIQHSTSDLNELSANDTELRQNLASLKTLIAERLSVSDQIIAARNKGGWKAAEQLVRTGSGTLTSERIEAVLASLEQNGFRANVFQGKVLAQSFQNGVVLLVAGYLAVFVVLLLAVAIVGRGFARRRNIAQSLLELRERNRLFTEGLKDAALYMLETDGSISHWNAAAERLQGFSKHEIEGRHFSMLFPEEDIRSGKAGHWLKLAEADGRYEQVGLQLRKDGSQFQARTVISPVRGRKGALQGYSVVTRDITELKRNEELLKKLSLTVDQAADVVIITDRGGKVEFMNKAVEEVTGFTRDEITARGIGLLQNREQDENVSREMWDTVLSGKSFTAEVTTSKKNGDALYLEEVVTPIKDNRGKVTHMVFTGTDVTPIKLMRSKLDFLTSYDSLTGLPNRDLMTDRLRRDVERCAAKDARMRGTVAVVAIDIDRFKYINEIYGLDSGNKVLKQVAESLSVSVSKGDTVGRLGSDEFGMVLHDIRQPADVVLFVKMIMKNVPQIIMSGGEEISVTLAAGIAMYPTDGRDASTLMKNADTALAKAKALGRNRYQFYTSDMNVGISELVFMEQSLSEALGNTEYLLTFQPYCYLSTRAVAGAEALLKWNNEEFGQVSPSKFIPLLEETGMIIDVGKWVLTTACRQIRNWSMGKAPLPVAVNLSPSQFRHEYLVETVEGIIRETGIDPRHLTLEITESTFMKDQDFAITVLQRLKDLGVRISIDDFGTGYSSLSYLKKFPVDYVKIDQSFVKDVDTDPDTTSLVTAIIAMAHSLGLKTIAEGVETEEQWKILRLLKCDMAQGYYFSPAVSAEDFEKFIV